MPLLTLPIELLLGVVAIVAETEGVQVKAMAATCKQLRVLCLNFLYERAESYSYQGVKSLLEILSLDSKIASYVRDVTLWFPDVPKEQLQSQFIPSYQEILRICPAVQKLRVLSGQICHAESFYSIMSSFIDQVSTSSRANIKLIELEVLPRATLWQHLKKLNDFSYLTTLYFTDSFAELDSGTEDLPVSWRVQRFGEPLGLVSVREFRFEVQRQLWDEPEDEAMFGEFLGASLPNVERLKLTASTDLIYGVLMSYVKVGSNLKSLTLGTPFAYHRDALESRYHLCYPISALAPQLVELSVESGSFIRFCHIMFSRHWLKLERLAFLGCKDEQGPLSGESGCEGGDMLVLRQGILQLLDSRPMADISIGYPGRELVSRKPGCFAKFATDKDFTKFCY